VPVDDETISGPDSHLRMRGVRHVGARRPSTGTWMFIFDLPRAADRRRRQMMRRGFADEQKAAVAEVQPGAARRWAWCSRWAGPASPWITPPPRPFALDEHHTFDCAVPSPAVVLAAIAARTPEDPADQCGWGPQRAGTGAGVPGLRPARPGQRWPGGDHRRSPCSATASTTTTPSAQGPSRPPPSSSESQ
jgi:hypothetical protein